ncbi:MAG: trypsin-like serine protease [Chloroflexi bacterium]|nr:trypsin-like serine protease [Chloroflexota bacterium]
MADVRSAVVQVKVGPDHVGAGTIWHGDGLVITNAHVASRDQAMVVLADGIEIPARVLARDPKNDLAALMIEAGGLPTVPLGQSRQLRAGQWVVAMGHPWGEVGAISAGIVIGTEAPYANGASDRREWIMLSLQLRPGHSGGPLLNDRGRLVGINTMLSGPSVGMAIPTHVVVDFLRSHLTI